MTHVEEGVLQAYLDAEVTAGARADIDRHLQSCSECNAELHRLRSASQLFTRVLRDTDVLVPVLAAQARIQAERKVALTLPKPHPRRALARAAMFVVGLAAVASAAVPGSPVRAWINSALIRVGLLDAPQSQVVRETPQPTAPNGDLETTSFAIAPVDGRVRIVLTRVKPEASVKVELIDGDRAVVAASGPATRARFSRTEGRFEVIGVEAGSVLVQIPRTLTSAVVEQDGKTIYKTGR